MTNTTVWIPDEQVYGVIVQHGAYVSLVQFTKMGIDVEIWMENDELEPVELWEEEIEE